MHIDRRGFLRTCTMAGMGAALGGATVAGGEESMEKTRAFHLSIAPQALDADPELLRLAAASGVTDVWLGGFFYGYWPVALERLRAWIKRIQETGMEAHIVNIPLGHPGNALGPSAEPVPLTPGSHWRAAARPDGSQYMGTSLHAPATEENVAALRQLESAGVTRVFLDDDFRLAQGPGIIGGCFCEEHRKAFLQLHGHREGRWNDLLDNVRTRSLTPVLRDWVEFTCGQLTACFRAQQAAATHVDLGIMVMYFGAEKAGIRLRDYRDVPMRVGELMFDDASFGTVKNKTAELFSCLFHRRFVAPKRAFSETTAFPADKLSANNMAAKLAISTLADVRNTMFMSGISPFPKEHWQTLAPAMRKQAAMHEKVAGHVPRGPFKHYWGEHSRMVGDDDPYSLFLATGVPFEVTERPARDGWTFLSDADAQALTEGRLRDAGTTFVTRPGASAAGPRTRAVEETLADLFALKREMLPQLREVPYIEDDKPAVCAWYPGARTVMLWNLSECRESFRVRYRDTCRTAEVDGLDAALLTGIGT